MARWLEGLADNIAVDRSKCTFCTQCVDSCIVDNLRFNRSPCREACPLGLNCQGYVQLIVRGNEAKSMETILKDVPFPAILGRVCSAPCEAACARSTVDGQAVAIRALKRYVADGLYAVDGDAGDAWQSSVPKTWQPAGERPEKVAILGGGPAGVMAACSLRRLGYQVAIFDAGVRLGGMLTAAIPEFRLPSGVATKELSLVERMGVQVQLNARVDAAGWAALAASHDALLIATGAGVGKAVGMPGEGLPGVYSGLDFLSKARLLLSPQPEPAGGKAKAAMASEELVVGRRVVVIGGGNTAIDAAQTAIRLGAEEVSLVCLEAKGEMPAFPWEVQDALEEGITIHHGWGPTRILSTEGKLSGIACRRCLAVFDAEGRFAPRFDEEARRTVPADTVVVAIGQQADIGFLAGSGIALRHGRVVVDADTLQTTIAHVFAAGDVVTGPATVVDAMGQGRIAAESIYRLLTGLPLRYGRHAAAAVQVEAPVDCSAAVLRPRVEMPKTAVLARSGVVEIERTLEPPQAVAEAERCLSCGIPFGKHRMCWSCLACEVECPEGALQVAVPYLMR